MAKKAGLGRGLDALFADAVPVMEELTESPEEQTEPSPATTEKKKRKAPDKRAKAAEDNEDRILYIDINDIIPNSAQPRKNFDEVKLGELAESIRTNGVISPLIVRQSKNGYELVAGERRWRASRIAKLKKVPCIVRDFDDRQNAIVAIIENMQREDLDPIEEALGLRSMTEKYGFTQEQVSASPVRASPGAEDFRGGAAAPDQPQQERPALQAEMAARPGQRIQLFSGCTRMPGL